MSTIAKFDRATPAQRERAVGLFKALSHPDRLRLACALGDGRVTTQTELVEEFGWPQSTVARHVAALRSLGLIIAERDGTEVRLRLGNPVALHMVEIVCDWVHEGEPAPTRSFPFAEPPTPRVGTSPRDFPQFQRSF
jgi:DNA-binding transcriptional ArsR family regulator